MLKSINLIIISFLTFNANARDPLFVRYPQINQNVASFTSAFISNLFPEIIDSQVRFDFSPGTDGVRNTDMAFGQIQGTYQGTALVPDTSEFAQIVMDFRVNLEVAPQRPIMRSREYAINFRADGNIDNTGNFMDFLVGILTPECIEDNHLQDDSVLGDICRAFVANPIDRSRSNLENAYDVLQIWKEKLIEGLNQIQHADLLPIKAQFIAYISDRILITRSLSSVNISINLENLSGDFTSQAEAFLKDTKLIDYSLNSLEVQITNSEINFSTHLVKRHVISSLNNYMELASSMNSLFDNQANGVALGQALREGREVSRQEILGQLSFRDQASAVLTAGMLRFWGAENSNSVPFTQAEQDLGLD